MKGNILAFARRATKPTQVAWVGPIEAERERCIAVFTSPHAQGTWVEMARVLARETAWTAEVIVAKLKEARDAVLAEVDVDIAAGRFPINPGDDNEPVS
jgi:hypothetical protein